MGTPGLRLFWTLLSCGLLVCGGCDSGPPPPLNTTFYHWETALAPSPAARRLLDSLACDRLYVKAFDLSRTDGKLRTDAWVEMADTVGLPTLVPVVFITNNVWRADDHEAEKLATDVIGLVDKLFPAGFPELQIDCDWTAGTRERYFTFLAALREQLPQQELSCTVRLHQYRDRRQQGVPPVDRGVLMAYNTGNLNDWAETNSIYDTTVVKAYLAGQPPYPLDLDLAVATYDWAAVYRRERLVHLINEPDFEQLGDTTRFERLSPTRYHVDSSTYLNGLYLYAGDLIRTERVEPVSVEAQGELLRRYVEPFAGQRLMVYRLGSRLW